MANKDGIVSIGFDYKKELDEVCATIEKELNNLNIPCRIGRNCESGEWSIAIL